MTHLRDQLIDNIHSTRNRRKRRVYAANNYAQCHQSGRGIRKDSVRPSVHSLAEQEAQLSPRDRAMRRVN